MGVKEAIEFIAARWAKAFGARDLTALAQLYTDDAMYIGPSGMRRGRADILEYLHAHWTNVAIKFDDLNVELLAADVALASLEGVASYDDGAQPRPFRMLQTYVWTAHGWRIAGHHGSYQA